MLDIDLAGLMVARASHRVPFDPLRPVPEATLEALLAAARWAPTAHNMQNFEIVAVDDPALLDQIRQLHAPPTVEFIRENFEQLSFSEQELCEKGTGLLASSFPKEWLKPDHQPPESTDEAAGHRAAVEACPLLLVVVYDPARRAPASEHDMLGLISLGCVLQNLWLTAEARGLGVQVISALSDGAAAAEVHRILGIPGPLRIAYSVRVGYPVADGDSDYLRVRRPTSRFVHRNSYARPHADAPFAASPEPSQRNGQL